MKFMPHEYQKFSIDFIKEHPEAMLCFDMGLGRQNRDFFERDQGSHVRPL